MNDQNSAPSWTSWLRMYHTTTSGHPWRPIGQRVAWNVATNVRDSRKGVERMEAMHDDQAELEEFGKRWAKAELARELTVLDALAHKDFILVGPLGFVIDKTQWLDRYRSGDLVSSSLHWRDTEARAFGDRAVVVGVHDQKAAYRGRPNNGQFRATHILVREAGTWRLVGMHSSPIAAPPRPPQQQG